MAKSRVDIGKSTTGINTVICNAMRGKTLTTGGKNHTIHKVEVDRTGQVTLKNQAGQAVCSFKRNRARTVTFAHGMRVTTPDGNSSVYLPAST